MTDPTDHRVARLMETAELAECLGVPVATLYNWRSTGKGPRAIKVGKHLRYRPSDVNDWLEAQAGSARSP